MMKYINENELSFIKLDNFGVKSIKRDDYDDGDVYYTFKLDLKSEIDIKNDGDGDVVFAMSFRDDEGYELDRDSIYIKTKAGQKKTFTASAYCMPAKLYDKVTSCVYYCIAR